MKAEKKASTTSAPGAPAGTEPSGSNGAPSVPPNKQESWRETIESIVIAFILAFLFRTFEAEAFVIPTGSMAPTLYGQHRDITCSECGTRFAVGASTGQVQDSEIRDGLLVSEQRLRFAVCPNSACHFVNDVFTAEIFAGDRILVNKFPYEFRDPARWDVVVFKFPDEAKTNYIKRLVGLPGEEVAIRKGDVWVRKLGTDDPWRIARKPVEQQTKLQILVHDNDRPALPLLEANWPESWSPTTGAKWHADPENRSFRIDPAGEDVNRWHWLRYTHYVPQADDWNVARGAGEKELKSPTPTLIRDVYAYNMRIKNGYHSQTELAAINRGELPTLPLAEMANEWVSDLTLTCEIHPESSAGEILLELVEGRRKYRCRFDLRTGEANLFYPSEMGRDEEDQVAVDGAFESGLKPGRSHTVRFCNVDDRLVLWVDDVVRKSVELDLQAGPNSYSAQSPLDLDETPDDRSPIGIAIRGGAARVAHLKIERDIYYTGPDNQQGRIVTQFQLHDSETDNDLDEFLMLGDNSPRSRDSRYWNEPYSVPRRLLIGKAFCIYWPHAIPFLNNGKGFPGMQYRDHNPDNPPIPRFSLPFYPQVGRMKRIW